MTNSPFGDLNTRFGAEAEAPKKTAEANASRDAKSDELFQRAAYEFAVGKGEGWNQPNDPLPGAH